MAVSASFGAGDVAATTPEMRREVLAHSAFAFFTTPVLAATVSVVATIAVSSA